jgi:hypothetical protein
MRSSFAVVAAVCVASFVASLPAAGQSTLSYPTGEFSPYALDSGSLDNSGDEYVVVWEDEVSAPGAWWIRVFFEDVRLDRGPLGASGVLRVTSTSEGTYQEFDAALMATWGNSTAYFNGDGVRIELIAAPHTEGNRVIVARIEVEFPRAEEVSGSCGICGPDDRVPSLDDWAGRVMSIGCSASVWNEASCLVSAGHCFGSNQVMQFRVPPSFSNCATRNPPPEDQFPILQWQFSNAGPGADWAVMTTGTNTLGERPFQRYGQMRPIATSPAEPGNAIFNVGYGIDDECERNQVQQSATGSIFLRNGTYYDIQIDITFGNSGSSILKNGQIIGIVTHCRNDCPNIATRHDQQAFSAARDALCPSENGTTTLPFLDTFPSFILDTTLWTGVRGALVNTRGSNEPSPPYSVNLDASGPGLGDEIRTAIMDTSGVGDLLLTYYYQRGSGGSAPEAGEDLIVEYRNSQDDWVEVQRHPGDGPGMSTYEKVTIQLPPGAKHAQFRLQFRTLCDSDGDDWYVDDVHIREGTACVRDPDWQCDGDVDGNGTVNPVDVGLVQSVFCPAGQCSDDVLCQYDQDCDGAVNPVDAGLVQSQFGVCDPPPDTCP